MQDDAQHSLSPPPPPPPPETDGRTPRRLSSIEAQIAKVFVAPRVVDQRTFDELSVTLKSLLKDAAGQSRILLGATGDVKSMGDQLRTANRDLQGKINTAVRLIPTIDQRIAKVEQLIVTVNRDVTARIEAFRDETAGFERLLVARVQEEAEKAAARIFEEQLGALVAQLSAAADVTLQPSTEPRVGKRHESQEQPRIENS